MSLFGSIETILVSQVQNVKNTVLAVDVTATSEDVFRGDSMIMVARSDTIYESCCNEDGRW